MSKQPKRNDRGQYARGGSRKFRMFSWVMSFFSLGLLYVSGVAVSSTFGAFRPCSSNNTGLVVNGCGKQSLNLGDLIILTLFVAASALVASLFTASWRMTRRNA